jgi:hypothetical protein
MTSTIHRSLFDAVYAQDVDKTYALIFDGGSPAWRNAAGNQALHAAAAAGSVKLVRILLNAGAKLDAPGTGGNTPLHYCAHRGHAEVVKLLLDAGADPRVANARGNTPRDVCNTDMHAGIRSIFDEWIITRCTFLGGDSGVDTPASTSSSMRLHTKLSSNTNTNSRTRDDEDEAAALLSSIGQHLAKTFHTDGDDDQQQQQQQAQSLASFDVREQEGKRSRFRSDSGSSSEIDNERKGQECHQGVVGNNNQHDDDEAQSSRNTSRPHRPASFQNLTVDPVPHELRRSHTAPLDLQSAHRSDGELLSGSECQVGATLPPNYIMIDGQQVLISTDSDEEWDDCTTAEELIAKFEARASLRVEPSNLLYEDAGKHENHKSNPIPRTDAPPCNLDDEIDSMLKSVLKRKDSALLTDESFECEFDAVRLDPVRHAIPSVGLRNPGDLHDAVETYTNMLAAHDKSNNAVNETKSPISQALGSVVLKPLAAVVRKVKSSGTGFGELDGEFTVATRMIKSVVKASAPGVGLGMLLEEHEGKVRVCRLRGQTQVRQWRRWLATGMVEPASPIGRVPEQHPAAAADIRENDVIVSIHGHAISDGGVDKATELLKVHAREIEIVIERVQARMFCGDAVDWRKEDVGTLREILTFVRTHSHARDVSSNVTAQDLLVLHDTFERAAVFALRTVAPQHTTDVFSRPSDSEVTDADAVQAAMLLQVLRDSARATRKQRAGGLSGKAERVVGFGSDATTKDVLREIAEHVQDVMAQVTELVNQRHDEDAPLEATWRQEETTASGGGVLGWAKMLLGG